MRTDTYTKGLLTVIAACLLVIVCIQLDLLPQAHANANHPGYATVPVQEDGTILVTLATVAPDADMDVVITGIRTSDEMEVELVDINTSDVMKVDLYKVSTDDELDVNVDEIGGSWLNAGGPIPVKSAQ